MKTVRRFLAAMLSFSLLLTVPFPMAHAVGKTNLYLELDKTEAEVGDTVTVTVKNRAMSVCSFTGGISFDSDKVVCTSIVGGDGREAACLTDTEGDVYHALRTSTVENAANMDAVGFAFASATEGSYREGTLVVATFEIIGSGNTGFTLYEDSDGTDGFRSEATETTLLRINGADPAEVLSGVNLALRGTAIVDSVNTEYTDMEAIHLNDDDEETRWQSNSRGNEGEDAWFGIQWNEPVLLEYLVVVWEKSHPTKDGFTVQISDDGETWRDTSFRVSREGIDGEDKQTDRIALAEYPTTTYVRLLCQTAMVVETEEYGEQIKEYPSAYELRAYGISTNLALDATATADSYSNRKEGAALPAYVNDGDISTRWQSKSKGTSESPAWLLLTWKDEKTIESAVISWTSAYPAESGLKLQSSEDGTNWTDIPYTLSRSVDESTSYATDTVSFTEQPTTKYLRVYCFDNGEGKYSPAVREIEVYGSMEAQIASDAPLVPTVSLIEERSITLTSVTGYEYTLDKQTWQSDPTFTSLMPATQYTFYQRAAATETEEAGAVSVGATFKTKKATKLLGDVNLDNAVAATDLTMLARHVGGIEVVTDTQALTNADANEDGLVDASDLTLLARFVGGIISEF